MLGTRNWSAITQLITNIGVLFGLAIVVYEIRETRVLTQAQLASEAYALIAESNALAGGEDVPMAMARACFDPKSVTEHDAVVLNSYFDHLWNVVNRNIYIEGFGFDLPIEQLVRATTVRVTSTDAGKRWYKLNRSAFPEAVRTIADKVADSADGTLCAEYLGTIRSGRKDDA